MKKQKALLILVLLVISISGCVPVRIYSDAGLTKKTGVKYYPVKPFLQVERDPATNRVVKSQVLYLPDLANPQYMAIKGGPGSSKADLKLTDGTINTFGFDSDAVIPETIEAFATLLSKGAGAVEDLNSFKGPLSATANIVELYEIVITADKTFLREVKAE
jgi:hypothetical protein